jgi:hypothetical protein
MAVPLREPSSWGDVLPVVVRCGPDCERRAKYALESLLMAAGVGVEYVSEAPASGPWLLYAATTLSGESEGQALHLRHDPVAWGSLVDPLSISRSYPAAQPIFALPRGAEPPAQSPPAVAAGHDILANAFYFLAAMGERNAAGTRRLYADSVFSRLGIPQDVVDRYVALLLHELDALTDRAGLPRLAKAQWPRGARFVVVLSHDVDFLPSGRTDILVQGAKTFARHLLRQRDPVTAAKAGLGLTKALIEGRDPYGCVPEIVAEETRRGVRSSFQVAVARRHPSDVNYSIEDDRVRDYLRVVLDAGFDLCLHGSYRSTERPEWYPEEARLLATRLAPPRGARQHFLSFDYDALFRGQERAGIGYDMSVGFPDQTGPRAGISYPYFPYCIAEDRPYDVVEIALVLMDVTLQSYLRLKPAEAWGRIERELNELRDKGGAASVVWHPIVFGGARDPGYDTLYWRLVEHVKAEGGLATDGRMLNECWRERAVRYPSFRHLSRN